MIPSTDDGRVLFAIPWHNHVVVGTTDTPTTSLAIEPRPLPEEIDFVMRHAARYLSVDPHPEDVRSMFAGLRPLVRVGRNKATAALARDHNLQISPTGLITITGGKWTTYRRMGADTVNKAITVGDFPGALPRPRSYGWLDDTRRRLIAWPYTGRMVRQLRRSWPSTRLGRQAPSALALPNRRSRLGGTS